jgi:hypothetical protein
MEAVMYRKILLICILTVFACSTGVHDGSSATVERAGGKAYIIDQTGYRWDVSEAESLGFKPELFQYGMGRNVFVTLDDSFMKESGKDVSPDLRVIGIQEGAEAQAYSVPRLRGHEISNSTLGKKPVAVGY